MWWEAAREHLEAIGAGDIAQPEAPLPTEYGNLLLVPPSWVYVTAFDDFGWRVPEGTEDLPVTEVSWYDAVAFAAWVRAEHDIECRLPAEFEWLRAANGGNLEEERAYPWGNNPNVYACNSRSFWGDSDKPQLLPVHYRYSEEDHGRTQEGDGLWAMSGNAAEWTLPSHPVDRNGYMAIEFTPDPRQETKAPVCGGSFRDGIQDCTVIHDTIQWIDKMVRRDDIGFRLMMPGHPLGG
jgi:formylglycine-generating enzyme required for sulfatase activity